MTVFYSGLILFGLVLSAYNWFYMQEVQTAKIRIGLTLPRRVILLFRGVFFACLFASIGTIFTLFATLFVAR